MNNQSDKCGHQLLDHGIGIGLYDCLSQNIIPSESLQVARRELKQLCKLDYDQKNGKCILDSTLLVGPRRVLRPAVIDYHDPPNLPQKFRHKVLKVDRNVPVAIVVVLFKRIRHALQRDTRLHKQIKSNDSSVLAVVVFEQKLNKPIRQAVLERHKRVLELVHGNVAAAVRVEPIENGAPAVQKLPQTNKLLKVEVTAAVAVKHAHHHVHRVRVKLGAIAVHQILGQLLLRNVADAACVESVKDYAQLVRCQLLIALKYDFGRRARRWRRQHW